VRRWDPERIGPYAIIGRLGAGAMGQVYLGRSMSGRLVAVKTIRPDLADEEGFRTRFAHEVAAARRVSGVFTAALVEADAEADTPWLATAYVPAPSLRRLVEVCGPLPPATVRWLAAGCAEALESIHGAGLVHMDLKPSNVLVAADGPLVIDFGVARAAARMGLGSGRGAGTPAYMAPEQARDITQASAASDVFSLGATLLYAATGHPPYAGETTADVLVRLATEPPDLAGLPDELAELISGCLERLPRQRPSCAALIALLGQFAEPRSYMPEPALALIQEYQHDGPVLVSDARTARQPGERSVAPGDLTDQEQTDESYPALPARARPDFAAPSLRSVRHGWREWLHVPAGMTGSSRAVWGAVAVVGLVAIGVVLGVSLSGSASPAASSPAAGRTTGTASSSPAVSPSAATSSSAGAPQPGPPPNGPPPAPVGPRCGTSQVPHGKPALCVNQTSGDGAAVFTVRSSGFRAGTRVSLTLLFFPPPVQNGPPPSPQTIRSFSIRADQSVSLGPFQFGLYKVVASATDGVTPGAAFTVRPLRLRPP